ncbi:MAG: RhuM family protein, partial [Bacteroidales bacterium]|nr:RhuM family protein [Bacteroidales bacterium]
VDQYLSFAELQARNRKPMYMKDWISKLNDFMTLNDKEILEHAGRISAKMAKELAESEYEKFSKNRIHIEDVQEMKQLEEGLKKLENKNKKK